MQHSSSNQMTVYTLSVCTAPSILCPSNSGSSELENNFTKKGNEVSHFYALWGRVPTLNLKFAVLTLMDQFFKVCVLIAFPWSGRVLLWWGMGRWVVKLEMKSS